MRIWRRLRGTISSPDHALLPTRHEYELLETEEQEKIVQSFEASHLHQSLIWRGVFSLFSFSLGVFFIYSAYRQALSPWDIRYHSYFIDVLNARTVILADFMEGITFAIIAWGLMSKSRFFLWFSFTTGMGFVLFWMLQMLRLSHIYWNIIWMPFGPSSCAAICLYVDKLLLGTEKDIKALKASMYHFKRT